LPELVSPTTTHRVIVVQAKAFTAAGNFVASQRRPNVVVVAT
jgi:hypothetical protein